MLKIGRRKFLVQGVAAAGAAATVPALLTSCAHPKAAGVKPVVQGAVTGGYFAGNFGVDGDMLRRTITKGLSRGGDFAEVFLQHKVGDYIGFEDGQVNRAYAQVDLGAGIRVLKGDQTGYAFTEELTEKSLLAAAETAAAIATGSGTEGPSVLKPVKIPSLYAPKQVWIDVSPKDKIGIAQATGELLQAGDPAIIKAAVHFSDEDEVVLIANSDGIQVEDTRPMTFLYATCVAKKGDRIESNTYSRSGRQGPELYSDALIKEIADETVRRTLLLFDAIVPPADEMPVVLAPATSGILLHEAMGHGFEADFNRKEISIFSTMLGKKIAEEHVTIVDTALEPKARGAINVDDEGTPGQETVLVKDGVLVSYLHDRISADHFKVERTGNGRREDFRSAPLPRMRVTTMENGPHDPDEIIASVDKGLYAVDFSNGEVAIGAGDYSFYVKTGYLIEGGKLTSPVKDVNLIGNGPDSLAKVVMVGNDKQIDSGTWTCGKDGQGVPVGLGLPTVKVSAITVGGVNS
ncbi:MAG: TldD/PmbA family protein [Deltaproteobacteria bacterium]|nr:TldD/PmbA family protein [Deltaproteobacteria bacterium]